MEEMLLYWKEEMKRVSSGIRLAGRYRTFK